MTILEEVTSIPAPGAAVDAASDWVARYPSTSHALRALVAVVRGEFEDEVGASILENAMREFAIHEEARL